MAPILDPKQKTEFSKNGLLIFKQFFDIEEDILPIQQAIFAIIGLVMERHAVPYPRPPFSPQHFDAGYNELIRINRQYGSEVYDLVKQIPAFLRLISHTRNEKLFCELRDSDLAGIGTGSYGIRIDNPFEEHFRSQWHQEFLFQPQSLDGLVFWTPLLPITPKLGPVMICKGSHRDGLQYYTKSPSYNAKQGVYQIGMAHEDEVIKRYPQIAPLTKPGDLLIMDYLTIHQSGYNMSQRPRWSIQFRFFNFHEPTGKKIGWRPSATVGTDIEAIFHTHFLKET